MPHLTADLEHGDRDTALPKGIYDGHVKTEADQESKATSAPMIVLTFELDTGEHAGREVPGFGRKFYIMSGGVKEDGSPHSLSNLFDTVNSLKADYTCGACGATTNKKFSIQKVGSRKQYFCPLCGKRAQIHLDGSWVGKPCRIQLDTEKMENSEDEANVVKRLFPRE